ncbi:anti-sigma factor domain-containing protein [Cohnella sp. GCM10020058]|uniref:anti-sigma factor domain-containing protein n=1 Tax=Cohnella sp. GCM10020058 TaxID=3317330 RepID=UPI003643AE73
MTQPHDRTCDLLELYMLGGLTEEEALRFEAHLASCESCREQRLALADIVGLLPAAVEPQPVPEGMKKRVLANVLAENVSKGKEPAAPTAESQVEARRSIQSPSQQTDPTLSAPVFTTTARRTPAYMKLVTTGLAAALLALLLYAAQLRGQVSDLRGELADAGSAPVQELKVNQAVKLNPAAADIVATGLATIVIDKNGTHLLVQAEQLPKLQGSEAYQVWLIKGQEKYSAGTFVSAQGTGALYYTLKNGGYDTVAITLEPDAFGDQPRGEIVLAASLSA